MQYKIIDNFFNDQFFDYLSSLELRHVKNDDIFNHHIKFIKMVQLK